MIETQKLAELISSKAQMNVRMGLELMDALELNPAQIREIFSIDICQMNPQDIKSRFDRLVNGGLKFLWLLEEWCKFNPAHAMELSKLDLSNMGITELSLSFTQCPNLKCLDVSGNPITSLPPQVLGLSNLESIILSGCSSMNHSQILRLLSKLPNLQSLDLSDTRLVSIPLEITELKTITDLDLSGNSLMTLPDFFEALTTLESLSIGGNRIQKSYREYQYLNLSSSIKTLAKLPKLTSLNLSDSSMETLPPQIKLLSGLTKLDLSYNNFVHFPEAVLDLTHLKDLNLYRNNLINLPTDINRLSQLEVLNLSSYESIEYFEDDIMEIEYQIESALDERSQECDDADYQMNVGSYFDYDRYYDTLEKNCIRTLPTQFAELSCLTTLDLSFNEIRKFPPEIGQLTRLESLNLSSNSITEIPKEIGKLTNLKRLDLSKSYSRYKPSRSIEHLPLQIKYLTQLTELNLDGNDIDKNERKKIKKRLPHIKV